MKDFIFVTAQKAVCKNSDKITDIVKKDYLCLFLRFKRIIESEFGRNIEQNYNKHLFNVAAA